MAYENNEQKIESVYSKRIRAGKRRTYFFDVRATRSNDYFLTITESRKRFNDNGYDRHKIFLYKEDFNKFIKALNEAVDSVRKQEAKHSDELKNTKYWWLKSPDKLTEYQKDKLNDFLRESTTKTAIAYQMKTGFDQLWQVHPNSAEPLLNNWLENTLKSGYEPFERFVKTVKNNFKGILKSIKTGINNAIAEGINSKIQMAKSRARRFRNMDNFKAMIYFLGNNFDFEFH